MKILVISVTRNRKGQPARAERAVEGELLRIGRGTQCEIHLPDPRVALFHADVFRQGDSVYIHAPEAVLAVNKRSEREARLVLGVRIDLGPYELVVEAPPAGYDLALAIELARPLPDDLAEIRAKSRTTLDQTILSKRTPAWTLAVLVALLFLALPVFNALLPPLRSASVGLPVTPDQSWNPGPLSTGHQAFGRNCGACHETPFVRVRDRVCIECHRKTPGHLQSVSLQQRFFGHRRCASCHAEHKGPLGIVRHDPDLCVACHGALKRQDPDTKFADVTDFASNHPGFKLTLWRGPPPEATVRIEQSDKAALVERSNLKFPHDAHLKPNLRAPNGRKTLDCGSCHVADTSGRGFTPIVMKTTCLECHRLEFEPAVKTRQVPHGSIDDVVLTMQEFYANIVLNNIPVDVVDIGEIRRGLPRFASGVITDEERQRALAWAKSKAQKVSQDLIEVRVCIVCHQVTRTVMQGQAGSSVAWSVAPVHVATTWMQGAQFDHDKHRTNKCADCHPVAKSHLSSDISIPDIIKCRECHAGNAPVPNKIVSTCVSCHDFHLPGHPPFGARADAMQPTTRPR